MNDDVKMWSNAHNEGSRFILGEGVHSPIESSPCCHGWRLGGEKLSVDSDYKGIRRLVVASIWWAVLSG